MATDNDDILCTGCTEYIKPNSKYASFEGSSWHDNCFVCSNCSNSLANVPFVLHNENDLLCVKCYDEKYGATCTSCQNLIKIEDDKFKHGDMVWHRKCFLCQNCQNSLNPNSFWMHEKSNYCKNCYGELFTEACEKCQEKIWKNGLKFRDMNLHKDCFVCSKCDLKLSEKSFFYKNNAVFCENCHNENFCKICVSCNGYITGLNGEEMISSKDEYWHNKCFVCHKCKSSLVGLSFTGKGDQICCPECFK